MAATTTKPPPILITSIDMSSLTQSELHSLSLLSNNNNTTSYPFSHYPQSDTVFSSSNPNNTSNEIPTNTTNNESPSLSPLKRRRHGPLSLLKRERHESTLIVSFLKQYLNTTTHAPCHTRVGHASQERENDAVKKQKMRKRRENVVPRVVVMSLPAEERENYGGAWPEFADCATGRKRKRREKVRENDGGEWPELRKCAAGGERKKGSDGACGGERKKKRRRRRRESENEEGRVDIVNRDGVVVDLAALSEMDDEEREKRGGSGSGGGGPFGEELRRRAGGREREEELLKMMGEMEGVWCSQRKKRRVVKACLLGNALPVGWKLIIALRRRSGRFSPYCRRYVSPTGEQLSSCKEVSSYLQSHFGINDANLVRDTRGELRQPLKVGLDNELWRNSEEGNSLADISNSTIPNPCVPFEHGDHVSALAIDNLPEVQVCDLYECHSCNVSFDVKDKYLQHLMSCHQRTTRRYSLGSSVGKGVTIKAGKYECKFCHEVFEEKCHFLIHVGNHEEDTTSLVQVAGLARSSWIDRLGNTNGILRMDALIKIAQSSIQDICPNVLEKEPSSVSNGDKPSMPENSELRDADFQTEKNSSSCPVELEIEEGSGEHRSSFEELDSLDKASQISSDCPNEVDMEKDIKGDKTSSEELNPSPDKVSEITMDSAVGEINDSGACPIELEMQKESDGDKSSSKELSPCDEAREIPMTDRNEADSIVCISELEGRKGDREDKALSEELNLHDAGCERSMIETETKQQAIACNKVNSKKNSYINTTAENHGSANELGEVFNIHYSLCNETPSGLDGVGAQIHSDCVDKLEQEYEKEYFDRELALAFGESHASGYTVPQMSMKSLSPLDETPGKAGQSGHQNLESVVAPEYMELNVLEPQMYNSMAGEDSVSLSEVSMGLENTTGLGLKLDASCGLQSEYQLDMAGSGLTTTFCVWCGVEFCHEVVGVEHQPDSVGFMCPTCRAKISKQFNELEVNFSLNPHYC